jgi:hypothetical protein
VKFILRRRPSNEVCTIGELYDEDGVFLCYTLEDVIREMDGVPVKEWKVYGKTAIPHGTYRITITRSEHFQRDLPLLNNVPGFSGIRIHPGNTDADTDGCILPGMSIGPAEESVLESRFAFNKLYPLIDGELMKGEDVFIEIRNPETTWKPSGRSSTTSARG